MNFTLEQQKELITFIEKYESIDSSVIKKNIVKYIDKSEYLERNKALAEKVGVGLETIYLWRQPQKKTSVSFSKLLKLADALEITVDQLIEKEEGGRL